MRTLDSRISMADIARLVEVQPPAVSNWRRRHSGFPQSEYITGQERFRATELAVWLDGRKIAKNDLKEAEAVGTTYGDRFRRNLGILTPTASVPADRDKILWRELEQHRGATDVSGYGDLILTLCYLRICDSARWSNLVRVAVNPQQWSKTGLLLEQVVVAHESSIPHLRRVLPAELTGERENQRLAEIIRILDRVGPGSVPEDGQSAARTFRNLLARFAAAEGKRGGEFFTPHSVVRVAVELIAPISSERLYDPCCGSGEFLVGAAVHAMSCGGSSSDLSFTGQALGERSWKLAKMNLILNGVTADLGPFPAPTLRQDLHAGEHFDVVMANPPFNMGWSDSDPAWDPRWRYGAPPAHNANFAWLQHIVSSLAEGGRAAVVMANGAANSENVRERAIRTALIENGAVEGIIALPPQLFYSTAIPVTLWLLRHPVDKKDEYVLFIDGSTTGTMVSRSHRILTDGDVARIVDCYREWRGRQWTESYSGIAGFARYVPVQEIRKREYLLNPRGYVAAPVTQIDTDSTAETVRGLRRALEDLRVQSVEVDATVDQQLKRIDAWRP